MKKNIYLLVAPGEFWLKPDISQILKNHGVDETWERLVFFGEQDEPETIIAAYRGGSLFSRRKFLLVKNAIAYSTAELDKLSSGLKPESENLLIILYSQNISKKERESDWYKNFSDFACIIDKSYPDQQMLVEIVSDSLKDTGKSFTADVSEYLAEKFAENVDLLPQELKKIAICPQVEITLAEVERILAGAGHLTLNDLSRAVMTGDYQGALKTVNALFFSGEAPLRILECIWRVVRLLYRAKIKETQGQTTAEILRDLRIYSFWQSDFLSGLKKFSLVQLTNGLFFIWQTERKLKNTAIDSRWLLETLIIRLFSKHHRQNIVPYKYSII